jgi:hypothetical protein
MSSGFSTTGGCDGTEQADLAWYGGVAEVSFSAVEQRIIGTGVLSARRDQRGFISAMAIDAEGCADRASSNRPDGTGGRSIGAIH